MEARRDLKEARLQDKVIWGLVPHVTDPYYIKEVLVSAEDVVEPPPQHGSLTDLGTHIQMTTTDTLIEVMH